MEMTVIGGRSTKRGGKGNSRERRRSPMARRFQSCPRAALAEPVLAVRRDAMVGGESWDGKLGD
jgi:hypothetical protein